MPITHASASDPTYPTDCSRPLLRHIFFETGFYIADAIRLNLRAELPKRRKLTSDRQSICISKQARSS